MRARGELDLRVPRRVGHLLGAAIRAARRAAGRWLTPGECLERVAEHFVDTWKATLHERSTPHRRVLARDGGWCQVPGCSRAAAHAHHVTFRSLGGADEEANLTGLCALCRSRHKTHYADSDLMPRAGVEPAQAWLDGTRDAA